MKSITLPLFILASTLTLAQQKQENPKEKTIENVTITKKVFQKKADRVVFDVAATPSTKGSTAHDLLKESPGVTTTDDKEFKILGKSAMQIFINGRKSNMSEEGLASYLKSTPAENISKIEVISVPGSEFNVPGNTGIINIILKKNQTNGTNGTLKFDNSTNIYNSQSTSASLNYRKDKFSANLQAGYSDRNNPFAVAIENGNANFRNLSSGAGTNKDKSTNINTTFGYDFTPKTSINFSVGTNLSNEQFNSAIDNKSFNNKVLNDYSILSSDTHSKSRDLSSTLNLTHKTDNLGSNLMLSAAYLNYTEQMDVMNRSFELPTNVLRAAFTQNIPRHINNYSFQADYTQKFKDGSAFGIGGNTNITNTDNNTQQSDLIGSNFVRNENLSNHFLYKENIFAGYTNYERNFGEKITSKVGIRYEYTMTKGDVLDRVDPINHFVRNYGFFLPFANANYAINNDHNLSFNFSSRIQRPTFWELNPVRIYTTKNNFIQNNPYLLPVKVYESELTYMFKNAYFLTANYTKLLDNSQQIPLQRITSTGDAELRYIRTNYGNADLLTFTLGMNKSFFKGRWIANYMLNANFGKFNGSIDRDPLTGETFVPYIVDRNVKYGMINLNNQFALNHAKNFWLGASYMYMTPLQTELGTVRNIQGLNLSLRKNWNNWTFKAEVNDVFNSRSQMVIENLQSSGYYSNVYQRTPQRVFKVGITYNFGNQKVKGVQKGSDAGSSIKNRTGGK